MTTIIDNINEILNADESTAGVQIHGICELVLKTDQPHPVSVVDKKQVAPNDRYDGIVYHRLLNDTVTDDTENSFGSTISKKHTHSIRTVVMIKFSKGKEWIDDFIDAFPSYLDDIDGFENININPPVKNVNQDEIFRTEFGESGYDKHRLSYHIYALEYTVEYTLCE